MRKFRFTSSNFKFLPTVLLAGALLILIVAPVFDADIELLPIRDGRIHQSGDVSKVGADSNHQASARAAGV